MNSSKYLLLVLTVFLLVACASAATYNFGNSHGDSKYEGVIAISDGKVAVSVAAVMEGTMTTNQQADDQGDEVGTEQSVEAEGEGIFAGSGASNGDESACTNTIASGNDATVDIGEQEAEVEDHEAEAEQEDATATGDSVSMVAAAEDDRGKEAVTTAVAVGEGATLEMEEQEAEVEHHEVEAEQEGIATGEEVLMVTAAEDGHGNEAVTVAAASGETATLEMEQEAEVEHGEAEAEQEGTASCDEAFMLTAAESDGNKAVTIASAKGEGATLAGEQEAEAEHHEAEAEQEMEATGDKIVFTTAAEKEHDTEVETSLKVFGAVGTVAVDQEAEVEHNEAEAEQEIGNAQGEKIIAVTSVDTRGREATAEITLRDGTITYAEQEAELEHNEVEAEQEVLLIAEKADVTTSAENWRGDSALTHAGVRNGVVNVFQEAEAEWDGAEAEQDGFVDTMTTPGSGSAIMDTHIVSSNGNEAHTGAAGDLVVSEQEGETGSAWVTQSSIVVAEDGHAAAWSVAKSNEGDTAGTVAMVFDGGVILTDQGAGAGRVHFGPVWADGAAAGQITCLTAFDGGLTESWASNKHADEGAAYTKDIIFGAGEIQTLQGAGAGEAGVGPIEAEGAVAAQWSNLQSTEGGVASSSGNNEFENFADTEVGYHGMGGINDTIQGAAAGEIKVGHHEVAEGAIAAQYTDEVYSIVIIPDAQTVWARSSSNNEFENFASTEALATGTAVISGTFQGAAAGEVDVFGIEAEGAGAIQHTDMIVSSDGFARASSNSFSMDPSYASTVAQVNSGPQIPAVIFDTTQGAGAGEVELDLPHHIDVEAEGSVAAQHTGLIVGVNGFASSDAGSFGMDDPSAHTSAWFSGVGVIEDTTQGAAAGEVEVEIHHHDIFEAEGAIAAQHTDLIQSNFGGGTGSWALADDFTTAGTGAVYLTDGSITGTTNGAAAGETEFRIFHTNVEVEGAVAGQHTDLIQDEFGGFTWSAASQPFSDEGSAITTNGFLFGEGQIVETTQGAIAGETEFRIHHTNVELEGAAAIQHTDEIESEGIGWAASLSNNEFDNFAGTADFYSFGGEISETTQGAVAGEIELEHHHHDLEIEGAAAGQYTEFVRTGDNAPFGVGFAGTGALHEQFGPDDFEFTGPGFLAPGSTTGPVFGIAAAGEIQDGFFIDGAIAFP